MKAHKIAIIDCGIGGLASAIYLTEQGHSVEVFDRFETPAPIGSGLVVQPVGQAVLGELGCLDAVLSKAAPIYTMTGTGSGTDKTVLHVDYGPKDGGTFGLGIHRWPIRAMLTRLVCGVLIKP